MRTEGAWGHAEVVAALGSEILSGERPPGSRMPSVDEMYRSFGVSRVVLREVTRTLAAKGMVTSKTRVGTLVLDPAHWNWLDHDVLAWRVQLGLDADFLKHLTDLRRAVEPAAAGLAARNRTQQDMARINAALQEMEDSEGNQPRFAEADLNFHVAVSAASRNPLFRSFTAVVDIALSGYLAVTSVAITRDERNFSRSTARHAKIARAIEARDEPAAVRAMTQVIDAGERHAGTARRGRR
ncbi:MAG: FadR family transcriptional regulator [Alphaproteobacteria bacterium]|nr:FadR family transcriptional regulator [Alphaproteobacteria bacterium]